MQIAHESNHLHYLSVKWTLTMHLFHIRIYLFTSTVWILRQFDAHFDIESNDCCWFFFFSPSFEIVFQFSKIKISDINCLKEFVCHKNEWKYIYASMVLTSNVTDITNKVADYQVQKSFSTFGYSNLEFIFRRFALMGFIHNDYQMHSWVALSGWNCWISNI